MESQIWCCCSVAVGVGKLRKGTVLLPGLWSFVQEETVPQCLPSCQTLQFLPACHWCPSSCCPGAEAQREWFCVSPKTTVVLDSFKRNLLRIPQFLSLPQSPLVFTVRNYGDLFSRHWNPGLGVLVWTWDSLLLRSPSWFLPTIRGCGTTHSSSSCLCASPLISMSLSLLPICMNIWLI